MLSFFSIKPKTEAAERPSLKGRFRLWIDTVGNYLVCPGDRITVGGPDVSGRSDVSLLANLSRNHITILRCGEAYLLQAHAETRVEGRLMRDQIHLSDGQRITLGKNVDLIFRMPSPLSRSARLDFASDHRPQTTVDGVLLMDDTCLLGPQTHSHVVCPAWPESVLLYRRENELWCKSRIALNVDGQLAAEGAPLVSGSMVSGPDLRFRVEAIETENQQN